MKIRRALGGALVAAVALTGCVDHASNSATFCRKNAELLVEEQDELRLSEDQAVFIDDELQKTMRYSEDGSRSIRTTARDLADSYTEIREISSDDDADEDDLEDRYAELARHRVEMREECAKVTGA